MLPPEIGCGSGSTCWRCLARWQRAGVWTRLHRVLLDELRQRGRVDLARVVVDGGSLRALRGGKKLDRTLPIAAKPGRSIMVLTDANGIPLVATVTAANDHDVTQLLPLMDATPARPGGPRKPQLVQGDRGYDSQPHRDQLAARGIRSQLAKRGRDHGSRLGRTRWVVERTIAWLHRFVAWQCATSGASRAFLTLACSLVCWYYLKAVISFRNVFCLSEKSAKSADITSA